MKCNYCGYEADTSEVFKWAGEEIMDEPEHICHSCFKEIDFIERIQKMTDEELKEIRSKRTPCECYARVVGYVRPVNQWNGGKQSEFADRKNFKVE